MPAKIHILKSEIANKIAAGEVVQRPASAVKELLENALDAGASRVTVLIKDAGKSMIQVGDNGEGMSDEDAALAFQRHATSKISTSEDLENIHTLGFRGEALASIGAVAQVELKTRRIGDDLGTLVRVEGDELKETSRTVCEPGTIVTVKNLFYNTPARRNFLKSQQTERRNVTEVVTRMAFAYPEVSWHYISDDETILDVRPRSFEERVRDVLGEKQSSQLVRISEKTDYLTVDGFIGRPDFAKRNRSEQYLFLNRRFILSRAINHAVFQAYEHLLIKGTFPFFILNLSIDPRKVDVNVHPSKMEVKFENESNVYRFVLSVVKRALATNDLVPSLSVSAGEEGGIEGRLRFGRPSFVPGHAALPGGSQPAGMSIPDQVDLEQLFKRARSFQEGVAINSFAPILQSSAGERIVQQETVPGTTEAGAGGRAIWQVHNKYILSQIKTGLMIVDQHVAHERILYEKSLANFENSLPSSQQLLFPQTLQMAPADYVLVKELLPHLETLGFVLKLFGKNTIVIEGIPADVRVGSEGKILQDLLDEFKQNEHHATIDARDNLAKSFACKAAIKAGDRLNTQEMISLIDQLFLTSMPYVCPHGRPVVVKISIDELDRRFGRT
ncbi:MAG: DNA mismatch repair endonuclease MutL [Ignavibacteriales bacterium]|nr:DNA mismatch repair endonuclease MutL [Ignavibacteriales bacterium]